VCRACAWALCHSPSLPLAQLLITRTMQTYLLLCAFTERFLAYLSLRSWPVIGTGAGRGGKRKSAAPSCGLSCHAPCR
jgi:hypothetical protein